MNTLQLHHGDCREVMRAMPSNSVDSIVTDPPYGLSFMGKKWDYDVPSVEIWAECLRVLKPGGHLLAFAGTRTQHRMACRIEDAGFEIRDMIAWVYGCLDDATEVATEHGVMPYHKTKIGDRVLCYNPSNGEYSYQPILEIVEYEYSDTAYRLVGDFGEQVVSRNHRVIVECGGSEAFQLAETLEREARVPVLEDLPALQQAIHDAHAGAGRAQQDMRAGMCGGDNRSEELGSKAAGNPQGADGGLRGVREAGMETGCVAAQGGDANVQPQMQWGAARSGMGDTCAQGAVGMVGGIGSSPRGAHDWAEQSGVEGRSNVSQPEGSLRRSADQVRAMPCWSNEHGPRGRLCHGASSCGGTGGWETTDANGVRASHQSRCDGQSAGEPDAVRHERTAQGIRAWGGHRSAVVRVVPFHYTGKVWCLRVPTGAFVAVRNGVAFPTGNSGFPKSLDVSKAIDKARRRDYVQVALDMGLNLPGRNVDDWTKEGHAPGDKWWSEFKAALPPETWQAIERRVIGSAVSGQSAWFARGVGDVTTPATEAARQWQGWGTALKPALETVTFASKPYTDEQVRDIIQSNLFRLETRLWLLSSANAAGKSSTSNPSEYGAACAIAQWNADEITSTRADLCDQMGTSLFELATTTSLNIVSSWRHTLTESWSDGNTYTTKTKSSMTIDWRTLKFSVSQITPASIIRACSLPGGFSANASTAESHFNASLSLLQSIRTLSATEPVISLAQHEHQGAGATPNLDPVVLARKPLGKGMTVAANVLAHGTGALNIDGCRVATDDDLNGGAYSNGSKDLDDATSYATGVNAGEFVQPTGRWPANLIHDGSDEVVAQFPAQAGASAPVKGTEASRASVGRVTGERERVAGAFHGDTGSAARFFYCAKASKKDRDEGLDGHETVIIERSLTSESPKWGNADQQVVLQVDTEPSPPKVIAVSGVSNKSAHEWSTLLFGSEHTAPCLQGTTCIIETPTSSTTGLTTLSYFQNLLTSANTQVANYETESGGSPAQTAAPGTLLLRTTSGMMASALGVEHAASPTLLKISVSARRSDHPTVKPTDLMAYLCRLVTPPGGVVLDPFMGSGSTGKAAVREGFAFIGIEREADYLRIATARIEAQMCTSRAESGPPPQNDLFSESLRA